MKKLMIRIGRRIKEKFTSEIRIIYYSPKSTSDDSFTQLSRTNN